MKITIYELLGMIKDGKASDITTNFMFDGKKYNLLAFLDKYTLNINSLNWEIEILEEQKKIPEKLDYCEENTFIIKCKENSYLTREEIRLLDSNFKELGNKINSIIDYLKSKGE